MPHSPGPWKLSEYSGIEGPDGHFIPHSSAWMEDAYAGDGATPESLANDRLISAAPDLLAQLKRAAQLAEIANDWDLGTDGEVEIDGEWVGCWELRKQFRAAIAKAEEE